MNKKVLKRKSFLMSHSFNRTKLFHSKKGWLITSALFFALLGGGTISASANVESTPQQSVSSSKIITKKATNLLSNMMANAGSKSNNVKSLPATTNNQDKEQQTSHNVTTSNKVSSVSLNSKKDVNAKANIASSTANYTNKNTVKPQSITAKKPNLGVMLLDPMPDHIEKDQASDGHWIYDNDTQKYASDGQFNDWKTNAELSQASYYGLNWKYSQKANAVEFTSGSLVPDVANATVDGPFGYNIQNPTIKSAKSLKFDETVDTSNLTSLRNLFGGNGAVYSLDLGPNFKTQNVTDMQAAFQGNTDLRYLNFGNNFDTSKVTNMNSMFNNDPSLQVLNLPSSFNTSNVTDMSNMFNRDTSLKSLTFPSAFNTNKVTTMHSMFESDDNLSDLDLSSFNTTNDLTDTGWMFCSDFNLKSITIPNTFHTNNVTSMASMFWNDHSLQSLTLPESFDTSNVTNMSGMFNNNFNLKSLNLPNTFSGNKVTTMHSMFESDYSLSDLDLSSLKTSSDLNDLGWMFCDDGALKSLTFSSDFDTSKVTSMASMFWGTNSLKELVFPVSFDTSNVTNMNGMLHGFYQLTIKSNKTKFNNNTGLSTKLYKQLSSNTYSDNPNNFNDGNIGTFLVGYAAHPITNPNQVMINSDPSLISNQWNQNYHFNNPQGQNNDIEGIIPHVNSTRKIDYWDVYYLWNPDPGNPGQDALDEWGQVRATPDFKKFYSVDANNPVSLKNVAIPNPDYEINGQGRVEVNPSDIPGSVQIPWEQVAGGSIISNKHGSGQWLTHDVVTGNPIDQNARLAYFANYGTNEDCYLAYANPIYDNGVIVGYKQFRPYSEQNVFTTKTSGSTPGNTRDPYVTVNPSNPNQLIAYCAGGISQKIYVLTSNDAVNWQRASVIDVHYLLNKMLGDNDTHNINSAEAPYVTILNGTPILFMSEQVTSNEALENIIYATGTLNNGIFQFTPQSHVGAVDLGHDVYAGNFAKINDNKLIFIGWSNSWGYPMSRHAGGFTLPRYISWNSSSNTLESTPIDPDISSSSDKDNNGNYMVNGKITINFDHPTSEFNLSLYRTNDNFNYVSFNFNNGELNVVRNGSANNATNSNYTVKLNKSELNSIQFYLDNDTISAYFPDSKQIYTVLDYDETRNTPYELVGLPSGAQITSYQFQDSATSSETPTHVTPKNSSNSNSNSNNTNSSSTPNTTYIPSFNVPGTTTVNSNNSLIKPAESFVTNPKNDNTLEQTNESKAQKINGHYIDVPNKLIKLTHINRNAHFYVHGRAIKLNRKAVKEARVLSVYIKNHKVQYTVKAGKFIGHVYGHIGKLKPLFKGNKRVDVHINKHKILHINLKRINVLYVVRKGSNVVYHIKFRHMKHTIHGVIYAKVTKRIWVPYSYNVNKLSKHVIAHKHNKMSKKNNASIVYKISKWL